MNTYNEKFFRNRNIYRQFQKGSSFMELSKDYSISTTRVRQIVEMMRKYYKDAPQIPEIANAVKAFGYSEGYYTKILNILIENGLVRHWRKLNKYEFLELDGVGKTFCDILLYAQTV